MSILVQVYRIPDVGINIGINIGCPDIGDMISRYRCQYRVPISGVPISGYDSHHNIGHDIGSESHSVLRGHSLHYIPDR